jgi:hypothetical protein
MLLGSLPRAVLPIAFEGETVASYCSRIDRATGAPAGHLWRIAAAEYRTTHALAPHARIPSGTAEHAALERCRQTAWTQTAQLAAIGKPSATSWYACLTCSAGRIVVIHPDFARVVCTTHRTWTGPITTSGRHQMGRVQAPHPGHSRPVSAEIAAAADRIHALRPSSALLWAVLQRAASATRGTWDGTPQPEELPLAASILETVTDAEIVAAACDYSRPYQKAYESVRQRMAAAANPAREAGVDQAWLMLRWTAAAARHRWAGEWNTEDPRPLLEPAALKRPAPKTLHPFEDYLDCLSENVRTDDLWWDDRFRQVVGGNARCLCPAGHVLTRRAPRDHRHAPYDGSCGLCSGHRIVAGYNSFADYYPWLAREWDDTWVSGPTPWTSSCASNRMGHWICPAGHHYPATFQNRALRGSGCPFCAKKKVLLGFNDLATTHGELARLWAADAGNTKTPQEISAGNCEDRIVWKCPSGHRFTRTPHKLVMTHGRCQTCFGKILIRGLNDLATKRQDMPLSGIRPRTACSPQRTSNPVPRHPSGGCAPTATNSR